MKMRWMHGEWIFLLFLFVFVLFFCSGCWDKKELNQLALAQTIAIDYEEQQYQVTLQLILPGTKQDTVTYENLWPMSGTGASIGEAIQQIALAAPRELYLDHLDLVLLGEGVLQQDIGQALEYLLKENVLRRRTSLLTVQGNAGALLTESVALAEMDIFYMENLLNDQSRRVHGSDAIVNAYYLASANGLQETLVVPRIKLKQGKELTLDGAALLQQGKLVSWVDRTWLLGYYWFTGGQEVISIDYQGKPLIVEATIKQCHWELLSAEPLQVKVRVHAILELISGYDSWKSQINAEQLDCIQKEIEGMILQQVYATILQAQMQGTDTFRLGRWLYAWHPKLVQAEAWPEQFAKLPIIVELHTQMAAK